MWGKTKILWVQICQGVNGKKLKSRPEWSSKKSKRTWGVTKKDSGDQRKRTNRAKQKDRVYNFKTQINDSLSWANRQEQILWKPWYREGNQKDGTREYKNQSTQ